MALAAELYADPQVVLEHQETGDSMPASSKPKPRTCFECKHIQTAIRRPPCAVNCMPSKRTGRCAAWVAR